MPEMTTRRVIGLGALNVDRIFRVERLLSDGENAVEEGGSFAGGSAANTIYGLGILGIPTGFCGAIGDDAGGQLLLDDFTKSGTETSHVITIPGVTSGTAFCLSSPRERSLYVLAGANRLLTDESLFIPFINNGGFLHISSFVDDLQFEMSLRTIQKISPRVRLSFAPGSLYISRGTKAIQPFIERTEVLFINRSEIEKLTGQEFRKAAISLLEMGCKSVAITFGEGLMVDGRKIAVYVRDRNGEWLINSGEIQASVVMDTTGAGDAFACGFIAGILDGKTPEECGRLGNCEALLSLKCIGARGGLPTRRTLLEFYKEIY